MSYFIDIKGQYNVIAYSNFIPRIGETVTLGPDSFPGQEDEIEYRVTDVIYKLDGFRLFKEMPTIILDPV